MNDPRGSIWRKWDLHIHTPASFHWNGGKRFCEMTELERDAALDGIVQKMGQSDIAAFGIMDYWTFEGYWALRDHIEAKKLQLLAEPHALRRAPLPPGLGTPRLASDGDLRCAPNLEAVGP